MNLAKEKLILEYMLSSVDLYARCASIIKSEYFQPDLRKAVSYLHEYYQKYSALPKLDRFKAEFDLDFKLVAIDSSDISYISDECERFAKQSAIREAIKESMKDINDENYDKVTQNILDSVKISLDRDVGIDLYENTEQILRDAAISAQLIPTNIKSLDIKLGGGCARKEFTLFSANSGVGKSVLMSNIGDNYAAAGYHVCYISLELSENKILSRLASIATGAKTDTWKQNIEKIAAQIEEIKTNGAGSYVIKRLATGSTANDVRAYLKQYQLIYDRDPDVILLDYLDVAHPIGGVTGLSVSEQDKAKSEQMYEIAVDYDAIMFSASQQNRDGIKQASPDQAVIAGGFSKINVVDNYISIFMTPQMRIEGIMLLYFLKTRSSNAVGENTPVKFNRDNLQITDIGDEKKIRAIIQRLASQDASKVTNGKKKPEEIAPTSGYSVINQNIEGLPMDADEEKYFGNNTVESIEDENAPNDLLKFMSFVNN
jgi:hypothetical protein